MIRCAIPTDFETLREYDRHISADELKRCISDQRVLVLEESGAFAGWLRFNLFWDEIPFMNMLYILSPYRGKGFAAQLTHHWEAEMSARGYKRVMTSTLSNEQAQFFYRKNGYRDCGCLLLPQEPLEIILLKELA